MSRRRKLVLGCTVVFLVVVLIVFLLLRHWFNATSNGTVHVGAPATQTAPVQTATIIKTPYFSTQLPAGFVLKRQTATPTGQITLLQLFATTTNGSGEQFAATIGQLPTEGLRDVGDYNLRVTQTSSYSPFTPAGLPNGAVAFRNTDDTAFTVFWPHATTYAELAFSSDGGASLNQLLAVYHQILTNWHWN